MNQILKLKKQMALRNQENHTASMGMSAYNSVDAKMQSPITDFNSMSPFRESMSNQANVALTKSPKQ